MKISDKERSAPLMRKPRAGRKLNPDSIEARCKRDGVKVHPGTIRSRMSRYNISYEEAIKLQPKTREECGKSGKDSSGWNKIIPNSSEEYQRTQGRVARVGEELEEKKDV